MGASPRWLGARDYGFTRNDRAHGDRVRTETIAGMGFARRYLRHVLPRGLRSIRHFGFCHPAAKRTAERVRFHSGRPLHVGPISPPLGHREAKAEAARRGEEQSNSDEAAERDRLMEGLLQRTAHFRIGPKPSREETNERTGVS